MRRAMLVNACYVSRAIGVIKVFQVASDLQGHSRTLAKVPFSKPHTLFCYTSIATMPLSFTICEILLLISQNLKRSRDPEYINFGGNLTFMHQYTSVSISTRHLKCPVSLIPKM